MLVIKSRYEYVSTQIRVKNISFPIIMLIDHRTCTLTIKSYWMTISTPKFVAL